MLGPGLITSSRGGDGEYIFFNIWLPMERGVGAVGEGAWDQRFLNGFYRIRLFAGKSFPFFKKKKKKPCKSRGGVRRRNEREMKVGISKGQGKQDEHIINEREG